MSQDLLRVELGCGDNKRDGFVGIDNQPFAAVDIVLDVDVEPLPFEDRSVEYIYTSHAFEHFSNYTFILREMFRVCADDATVEIWTPYGKSNDAFLFGHNLFMTETHFKHVCFEYDRFYLGDAPGYFRWYKSHYNLYPGIVDALRSMGVPLPFALEHMFNIALEWGVFLSVKRDAVAAPGPQIPERVYSYGRDQFVDP